MHLGILLVVNFADLTIGMLMIHLFTFDPRWFPARAHLAPRRLVLFDGVCGLCDHFVQFLLDEDRRHLLRFSPLQGETARSLRHQHKTLIEGVDSIGYVKDPGLPTETLLIKSDAIFAILDDLGGLWRPMSWARLLPRHLRDYAYEWVAKHRYRLFGRHEECRMPTAETRAVFLP